MSNVQCRFENASFILKDFIRVYTSTQKEVYKLEFLPENLRHVRTSIIYRIQYILTGINRPIFFPSTICLCIKRPP